MRLVLKEMCSPLQHAVVFVFLKYCPHLCDIRLSCSAFTLEVGKSMNFIVTCVVTIRRNSLNFFYLKTGVSKLSHFWTIACFYKVLLEHAPPIHLYLSYI